MSIKIPFFLDYQVTGKPAIMNNVIKVPIVFAAELVKSYPEYGVKMFMPYSEIKEAIMWHNEHMPKIPIVIDHVDMYGEDDKKRQEKKMVFLDDDDPRIIGYLSDLKPNDEKKRGEGYGYININKLTPFIYEYIKKGYPIGVSVGGYMGIQGNGGKFNDEEYDISQMDLNFHHIAIVVNGLARCPLGICGLNIEIADMISFDDKKEYPWVECIKDRIAEGKSKEQAERICGYIKAKSQKLGRFKESFVDAIKNQECVKRKVSIFANEHPEWNHNRVVAAAINYCKNLKDSFDIKKWAETPPEDFINFHDLMKDVGYLFSDSPTQCFYDSFKWALESVGIKKEDNLIEDNNLLKTQLKIKKIKMSELEELKKQITELTQENQQLKALQIQDAEKTIKDLRKANEDFDKQNTELKDSVKKLTEELNSYRTQEIKVMQQFLFDSRKFSPEQIKNMDYDQLKQIYSIGKLFIDNSSIKRPTPVNNNVSVLPIQQQPNFNDSENPKPLPKRKYTLGTPPPMSVVLDSQNDHWKSRYGDD